MDAIVSWAPIAFVIYAIYRVTCLLVPPPSNDGGVPYIPVYKTLQWMRKRGVGRYEVSQQLDKPYFQDGGIVKAWMFGGWSYKVKKAEYARKLFMQTDVYQKVDIRRLMPYSLGPRVSGDSLTFENNDAYRGHRAIVSPAFRRSWPAELFKKPLLELIEVMRRESTKPLDALLWFRRGTLDVLGHIIMSYDFGALRDPDNKQRAMYDSLLEAMLNPVYNMFPWLDLLPFGIRAKQWGHLRTFQAFIDGIIDSRIKEVESRPPLTEDERNHADLLTLLLESYHQSKSGKLVDDRGKQVVPLTREQLRSNISLFYVAGYDTTANSLSYVMMELARHPDIQKKARDIVIGVLGDQKGTYPTDEQIKDLGYLDLIVKETLRRNSILAEIRRRLSEPVHLGPYTLPKGAVVSVDTWAMHYDPTYFPDPELFVPERFAEDKSSDLRGTMPFSFSAAEIKHRLDLCNNVDIPALRETGLVRSWLWGRWMYKTNRADYARQLFLKTSVYEKIEMHNIIPYVFRAVAAGGNLMTENGDAFKAHRSIVGPAFRRSWPASTFRRHLDKLERIIKLQQTSVDVLHVCRRTTLDLLGHTIMGIDFGALDYVDGELLEICWDVVEAGIVPLYLVFPVLDKYPFGKRAKSFANLKKFHRFIESTIENKRKSILAHGKLSESERNNADLLTLMIEAHEHTKKHGACDENGKPLPSMTQEELRNNTIIFFVAGHDATAYGLSHMIMELALNPDTQQRARERVISVLGDKLDAFPTDEQLAELADLDAIVKESLRKNSVVSDIRRVLKEPVNLGPYTLPKGAWVMVDLWAMQNNPEYYPKPEIFDPSRFEDAPKRSGGDKAETLSSGESSQPPSFSWAPFSEGSRKCIGHKFALLTQRVMLIMLVHRFSWHLPKGSPFLTRPLTTTSGLISPIDLKINFVPRHKIQ
ncbi:hypothetical protein GGI11_001090 [Coemansia sp. RSA 2049]|nr:hypothetical protein GGI11_001090 [Coemansia sp. RSA 2049]